MAEPTIGRRSLILVIHVTLEAALSNVRTRKRESRVVVIELTAIPIRSIVALPTIMRESGSYVIGIVGIIEIILVA